MLYRWIVTRIVQGILLYVVEVKGKESRLEGHKYSYYCNTQSMQWEYFLSKLWNKKRKIHLLIFNPVHFLVFWHRNIHYQKTMNGIWSLPEKRKKG